MVLNTGTGKEGLEGFNTHRRVIREGARVLGGWGRRDHDATRLLLLLSLLCVSLASPLLPGTHIHIQFQLNQYIMFPCCKNYF